jgi:hypothetical protein
MNCIFRKAAISDYRPISLMNSLTKVITKILVTRLAPHMNELYFLKGGNSFAGFLLDE